MMKVMEELVRISPGFGGFDFPYENSNVVFLGVPLDITSSYRTGYRFAPTKIREASANLETYLPEFGLDVFEVLNITDLGDLVITPSDIHVSGERIKRHVKRILSDGKFPILLGGEHTITYFATQVFEDFFVVQLDAHRDLRDEYLGDRICHATVMRRILDFCPPERVIQVGIRSCSKEEAEFVQNTPVLDFSTGDVKERKTEILDKIKRLVGSAPVYLTIDLDVLDPAFAPGVATPEPGGISVQEMHEFMRGLGDLNLVGCDIVEFVPPHDNGTTAFVAAKIAYEILGLLACKKVT
jgi:agmatinase